MRLWYEKGSILLRIGDTIWKIKAKNIYRVPGYVLNWAGKQNWLLKRYTHESQWGQIPRNMSLSWNRNMISAIRQQSSWRPSTKKLPDKNYLNYYYVKIRSCDTIVCLFGVGSTSQAVWVSKKVNDPIVSGVALVRMLVQSLLAWSRLWSKHEMHAAELNDEVESEVQATTVGERVQMRESSSNVYWDILLCI